MIEIYRIFMRLGCQMAELLTRQLLLITEHLLLLEMGMCENIVWFWKADRSNGIGVNKFDDLYHSWRVYWFDWWLIPQHLQLRYTGFGGIWGKYRFDFCKADRLALVKKQVKTFYFWLRPTLKTLLLVPKASKNWS